MKYIACSAYDKNWKSNHRQSFYKKALMKIFVKFSGKQCQNFFQLKFHVYSLQLFFKKEILLF